VDALGDHVSFELAEGRRVRAPAAHVMLYDDDGRVWPRCSLLVGPIRRTATLLAASARQRRYYGDAYALRTGYVDLPPVPLHTWEAIGPTSRIYYQRPGTAYPGYFQHPFNKPAIWDFLRAKRDVLLYRQGSFLRLELGRGCVVNWRGFVKP